MTALGFLCFVLALQNRRPHAARLCGLQYLVVTLPIESDKRVCVTENCFGRTIVVFEPHDLGFGPNGHSPIQSTLVARLA